MDTRKTYARVKDHLSAAHKSGTDAINVIAAAEETLRRLSAHPDRPEKWLDDPVVGRDLRALGAARMEIWRALETMSRVQLTLLR